MTKASPTPPKPRGLAALLPESVVRGAQAATAARVAPRTTAPDEGKRRALRAAPKPKALPPPRPAVGVVASPAGVLADERGRLPSLDRLPNHCALILALPSGRQGGVAGASGILPKGLRWVGLADLPPEDRADAVAAAPDLGLLEALADAEGAAREVLAAAGQDSAEVARLSGAEALRLAAERLRAGVTLRA